MEALARPPRRLVSRLVLLAFGVALGAGLATAHFTGLFTPLYHRLGLHSLHGAPDQPQGGDATASGAHAGHAGHGGMSMPQVGGGQPSQIPGYAVVTLSPQRQQLIGVRTGKVKKDRLLMSIRAVGIIEPDQTRLARVHTRISGWVTKVHVNFVGQNVKKGDPLLEIYSPELLATQEEYLLGLESNRESMADAARRKLELQAVPAEEIRRLEKTRKARETLTFTAPLGGRVLDRNVLEGTYVEPATELYRIADLSVVWLQAKLYEYELPHIEIGQLVRVTLASQPEREIEGKVSFVEPVLQEATRTVKVRVALDNRKDLFKPGTYANLVIEHDMGEGLLIPESGLLQAGDRALAFRIVAEGRFEPVEVKLGSRFGERWQVLAGLSAGDDIVTSAIFLIDAESRLKSAASAFGGHQHGSGPAAKPGASPETKEGDKPKAVTGHEHHGQEAKPGSEPAKPDSGHEHHHHE
jgi:Cu(I)/Ag(I) efflux system membrane fusion protein